MEKKLMPIEETLQTDTGYNNRCPDYDEDCKCVQNHLRCFLGINSVGFDIGIAKGYCPFIQTES